LLEAKPLTEYLIELYAEQFDNHKDRFSLFINGDSIAQSILEDTLRIGDFFNFSLGFHRDSVSYIQYDDVAVSKTRLTPASGKPVLPDTITSDMLKNIITFKTANYDSIQIQVFSGQNQCSLIMNYVCGAKAWYNDDFDPLLYTGMTKNRLFARLKGKNKNMKWSHWSKMAHLNTADNNDQSPAKDLPNMILYASWKNNKDKETTFIQRDKWHNLIIKINPAYRETIDYFRILLHHEDTPLSMSLRHSKLVFNPEISYTLSPILGSRIIYSSIQAGSNLLSKIEDTVGLFINSTKEGYIEDNLNNLILIKLKLLNQARLGNWIAEILPYDEADNVYPGTFVRFIVINHNKISEKFDLIVIIIPVLLVISLFAIFILYVRYRRKIIIDKFEKSKKLHSSIEKVINHIKINYSTSLNINDLSHTAAVSKSYLSTLFKEQTGENLFSYINKVRIEKSKEMLRNTDLSISEIAYKAGFTEPSQFNRVFKKQTGITPTKYRNNL
ncbi:MAG: AraC family transcriptional regulator, partial [bacterium]